MSDSQDNAGPAGETMRCLVRDCLLVQGRLLDLTGETLAACTAQRVGGLYGTAVPGDFFEDVAVAERGVLNYPVRADFLIRRHDWKTPLAVFCYVQNGGGTADRKAATDLMDAKCYCPVPSMLFLMGEHWEAGAKAAGRVRWLREVAADRPNKVRCVLVGAARFRQWVQGGMPWPGGSYEQRLLGAT